MPDQSSSFIPKSGVKTVKRSQGTKQIYLLAYISYIVFFSTLFAVIGVYIYGAVITRSLDSIKAEMVAERQRFAVSDIENIKQLDQRLSTAARLVNESTAPSRIFPDIENIVASNIRFSGMKYEQLLNRQFQIELNGEAEEFNEIIGQTILLENSPLLENAEVVEYDYSVSGDEGSRNTGDAVLTFVFADTRDITSIAYQAPEMMDTSSSTENVIIDGSINSIGTAGSGSATSSNSGTTN